YMYTFALHLDLHSFPIKATFALLVQGSHLMVTKELVGFLKNSEIKSGISAITSSKCASKKALTFTSVSNCSKEFSPWYGINKVQVKLPSKLGRAISINSPLGHM